MPSRVGVGRLCVAGLVPLLLSACGASGARPVPAPPAASPAAASPARSGETLDAEAMAIWREFVIAVRSGPLPDARIRVYPEMRGQGFEDRLRQFLRAFADDAGVLRQMETAVTRVVRDAPNIHYVVPVVWSDGTHAEFLFTLVEQDGAWYFRILESLQLPIYEVPPLPASSFPDDSEEHKSWRRAEDITTREVRMWNRLRKDAGEDAAYAWFRDGPGYAVEVKTWLPLLPFPKAFVVFAAWEQSRLWGEAMSLVRLDDRAAVLRFEHALHLRLYRRTAHLAKQIPEDAYRKLFETKWVDRCRSAGWDVTFAYGADDAVELRMSRP